LVRAQSTLVLTPGQTLELEVVESGRLPQLKIISPAATETVLQKALLNNIAAQRNPALLPKQLLAFSKTAPGTNSLPPQVRNLAQSFLTNLPNLRDLSTLQGIKQAIGESGIFLEARLASLAKHGGQPLDKDLKASLLRFAAGAESAIKPRETEGQKDLLARDSRFEAESSLSRTLVESTKGALSRIVLDQISSLPQDQPGKQVWNLEIPFLNSDRAESARLTIQRDTHAGFQQTEHQWSVILELNPPNLGTLQCKISLAGDRVNAYFRAESESTHHLIQSNLELLEQQLSDSGLSVGSLASGTGLSRENPRKFADRGLFDEHA
ncbi:MAG: flagellar hook-length control protein FliK, partial [Methylococcaceae bacterium]|nr:flagellar hook-length control protein FliK [Methylococcaceae bacterium]